MSTIRPARTCREIKGPAWARYSAKKPKKNYIKARPHTSLLIFNMGKDSSDFDLTLGLVAKVDVQLRSNAIEAARQVAHKYLESKIPNQYYLRVVKYPHHVIREKKRLTAAGADRLSQGMAMAFGRPSAVAARVYENDILFLLRTKSSNKEVAKTALERASKKLSGKFVVKGVEYAYSSSVS